MQNRKAEQWKSLWVSSPQWNGYYEGGLAEGNYLFTGVVSITLSFHPQERNVNDVTNEGKN